MIDLSVRDLELVVAIAETGSLHGAARRLHVAQPPVSRSLRSLEERFGVRLFERTSRGTVPTPEGSDLVERAADLLRRLDETSASIRDLGSGRAGVVRIGYTDDFQYGWFTDVLAALVTGRPDVEIHLEQDYTAVLAERVALGHLDVALVSPPLPPRLTDLQLIDLPSSPLRILLAAGDPLARVGPLAIDALRGRPLIVGSLRPESGFYLQVMQALQTTSADITVRQGIYPTAMIANLVARGLGWGLVTPESHVHERSDVTLVEIAHEGLEVHRAATVRRGPQRPAVRELLSLLSNPGRLS